MSSFLALQEEDQNFFVATYENEVREHIESRLKLVHFISDILEHFIPRFSDTLAVLAGGDVPDPEDAYLTIREDESSRNRPPLPGAPKEDGLIR